jgi:hypothetical protein
MNNVRRTMLLVASACGFVLGWVLPVLDDYRGWQAFRVALSPVWPYENFGFAAWYDAALTVASGLTNAVFIAVFLAVIFWRSTSTRLVGWVLIVATLMNLHWLARAGPDFVDLRVGYYVWLLSFPLLALAARRVRSA